MLHEQFGAATLRRMQTRAGLNIQQFKRAREAQGAVFLFKTENQADRKRLIWRDVEDNICSTFQTITAEVAAALGLEGTVQDEKVSQITSFKNAARQQNHVDIDHGNCYSFLYALNARHIYVTDRETSQEFLVRMPPGSVLVRVGAVGVHCCVTAS